MMTKEDSHFSVEGPGWKVDVSIDLEIFQSDKEQFMEAATRALEIRMKDDDDFNVGPIIRVKKKTGSKVEKVALVNSYICLKNAAHHKIAEILRENYKKETGGQDLSLDSEGFSWA